MLDPAMPGYELISELQAANEQRITEVNRQLAPSGRQLGVNRAEAVLEALLDVALGTRSPQRAGFEKRWQEQIRDTLDQAESEMRHAELLRGVNGQS